MAVRGWPMLVPVALALALAGCVDPNERTQPDAVDALNQDLMPVDVQVLNTGPTWARVKFIITDQSANATELLNETAAVGPGKVGTRQTSIPRGHTLEVVVVEEKSDEGMFRIFPGGTCPGKLVWRLETAGEGEPVTQSEVFCDRGAAG